MIQPNNAGSANTGSPANSPVVTPNNPNSSGAQTGELGNVSKNYEELEKKLGTMGQELGEYRTFFNNIAPLLDKLDQSPELVQAILDGKIDKSLAQAVYDGKVNISDAAAVSQAAEQVKKDLGKNYQGTSPEEITKMIEQKVNEVRKEFEESANLKDFETRTQKFIENTPDFVEYSEKIDKWLDEHDVTDIEIAYWAVKGKLSQEAATKKAEEDASERVKETLMNASGGGVTSRYAPDGTPIIDKLIAGRPNPNIF